MYQTPLGSLTTARYGSESGTAYLTGIQALGRLLLDQRRLDEQAGHDTAGFVSGYRGSPLGGLDRELWSMSAELQAHRVVFQSGVNEDLAATAVWGSQQVGLFPSARHDGVFGMWYGKAPGLDRSSDALRHANAAGTNPRGGVLLAVGDDHACKSSTLPSASEFALRDLGIPVLAPADVQDLLDFGLFGWALSRYAGCWAGLVVVTEVADSALTVATDLDRHRFVCPPVNESPHIRLNDSPLQQEARLVLQQRLAVDFAAANDIDRIVAAPDVADLVVVTAGKTYHDVREALAKLGLASSGDIAAAGVRLVKLGMTWPLNAAFVRRIAEDAKRLLVVEEKRSFVEDQLKAILFATHRLGVIGKGEALPATGTLDAATIAKALADVLPQVPERRYLQEIEAAHRALDGAAPAKQARKPLFCAGCPHNVSTRVPEGSRAGAGIGCHYMAQWMDRATSTATHMGAEGVNWIGQAPFTEERHMFVNLGDGTYFHSGILAIRAAVAAGVNVTYKVLANDAVAMTGGQPVDGSLAVTDIAAQVRAEGVAAVRVVSDEPRRHRGAPFPVAPRSRLDAVQRELRATPGCTVLIYEQTCATELRRRRKRGTAPEPNVRVVINDAVCEGCGDCSRQSNCVAVAPLDTEYGTKRRIDQSACNVDLSCLAGFCPAFVTVRGTQLKRTTPDRAALDELGRRLPAPQAKADAADILIAGVGGAGVVTISQLLGTAAHLDGKFAATLDMTGLAQKGGAVFGHVRIAPLSAAPAVTGIPAATADLLLAADLITATSRDSLDLVSPTRTLAVANAYVAPTAEFVLAQRREHQRSDLEHRLRERVEHLATVDANGMAQALFGTSTCANVVLLGHAFQSGAIPISLAALQQAITINGVAVEDNLAAFHIGRAAAHDATLLPDAAKAQHSAAMQPPTSRSLDERVAARRDFLVAYQDEALAVRYAELVDRVRMAEQCVEPDSTTLAEAVAGGYFKLLAIKDEYEVARLFTSTASPTSTTGTSFAAKLAAQFEPGFGLAFHFAPPWLARRDDNGRPRKVAFGGWVLPLLRLLAAMRRLRGSWLDPFRYSKDHRLARELLRLFEADFQAIAADLNPRNLPTAVALARLPATIKGFGPVQAAAATAALARRERLLAEFHAAAHPAAQRVTDGSDEARPAHRGYLPTAKARH